MKEKMKYTIALKPIALLLVIVIGNCSAWSENIIINSAIDSVYLFDNFDLTNTVLDDGNSGVGFLEAWKQYQNGPINVNTTANLSYPSNIEMSAAGGSVFLSEEFINTSYRRKLTNNIQLSGGDMVFYLSFLAQKTSNSYFRVAASNSANQERFYVGVAADGKLMVNAANTKTSSTEALFDNDKCYLLVSKYTFNVVNNQSSVSVKLIEDRDIIPEDDSEVEWDYVGAGGVTGAMMEEIKLVFNAGVVQLDELKVGSTWRSVTSGGILTPSNLKITPDSIDVENNNDIAFTWDDNSDNELGFKLFSEDVLIAQVASDVCNYILKDYREVGNSNFSIAAYNDFAYSSKSNIEPLTVSNVSGLILLDQPANAAVLYQTIPYFSWQHELGDTFSGYYEIMIDDDNDFSSPIDVDTTPSFINYYSPDFELDLDVNYFWKVRFISQDFNSTSPWSRISAFVIVPPVHVVDVLSGDGWSEIRDKWQRVLDASKLTIGAVELRFPKDGVFNVVQDPNSDESDRSNGFLLYVDGCDNVFVNGRGSKIIMEATHGEWLCGFMEINNSKGMQVKNIIIDYHPNSLYQIGGVIQNYDKDTRTFEVVVDTSVYKTYEVLKGYQEGYFLSQENKQKIGLKGVDFQMEQTWEEARINDTLFSFTGGTSEYGRYRDELEDGDYFVLSHRGGDIMFLSSNVDNFVLNNMTTLGCRGRFFSIDATCTNSRCLNNNYLVSQGRIMGSSSGGVGVDRGDNVWYENNRYEYTRDDMFHNGSNAGKGSVFRSNHLIGAYRNSIWVQADCTWVSNNRIEYAGTSGIHIGYAPSEPGTLPSIVLIEGNTIMRPNWHGIEADTDIDNPDYETGSVYSENIVIRNNRIIDNYRDEAILLEYVKNAIVENNTVSNTIDYWSYYSTDELQLGIHIINSENVSGSGNQILDTRLFSENGLLIDENCHSVDLSISTGTYTSPVTSMVSDFFIYPNPSKDGIFHLSKQSDYKMISADGQYVESFFNTNMINISAYTKGLYLLVDITDGNTSVLLNK